MAKKKSNLKTKKSAIKTSKKKKIIKKNSKKTLNSKKKTNIKSVKNSTKGKKTSKVLKNVKKKVNAKKKKELQKVKPKTKIIKKTKKKVENKPKKKVEKKPKKIVSFDDHIKDIIAKLLNKHKVDGVYTNKIIEKAVPKKFRIPENILKVEEFLKNNNITIVSEKEAAALNKAAKEESSKKDEDSSEEEKKQTGKTDDPVRLYLRDMGAVELLSREGEIAIAKRIEAGREKMIGAICESPMTIRSIINWKDSIKDGTMLLRDIVDLEATYDMSDIGETKIDDTLQLIEGASKKEVKSKEQKNKSDDLLVNIAKTGFV